MPNTTPESVQPQKVGGFLGWIERIGNKIPDITMLFIAAFFITCIVSIDFFVLYVRLCQSGDRQADCHH